MALTAQEISDFLAESMEMLEAAEQGLLAIDRGESFAAHFDGIFRALHNIKGAAGMIELDALQAHLHGLETLLTSLKELPSLPKETIDRFLVGVDKARTLLRSDTDSPPSPPDTNAAVATIPTPQVAEPALPLANPMSMLSDPAWQEFLSECDEVSQRLSLSFAEMDRVGQSKSLIDSAYRDLHTMKGSSLLFGYQPLASLSHAMESCLESVRTAEKVLAPAMMNALFLGLDLVDQMVANLKAGKNETFEKDLQILIPSLAELNARSAAPTELPAPVILAAEEKPHVAESEAKSSLSTSDADRDQASTVRVSVSLLDKLMTLTGEMVLIRNQVLQYSSRNDDYEFVNLSQRLNSVTAEIQTEMMKTRMQPIANILNKFPRVVRDLGRELGKDIQLNLIGVDTELDKTLLEAVKDPLTHVIRNSCDHGIELSEERKRAGKPAQGTLQVRAFHESGQVIIEVRDDGRGLHRDKLVKKAIEKGLLTAESAVSLTEREAHELIFAPGFSTAEKVTNVSGRGVGMDVVRNNIERIGGTVELASVAGVSTTIRLKIPLTLAIIPALIIRCGQDQYAIPQLKLVELVRVRKSGGDTNIESLHGKPVIRLRGKILPLIDLKDVLDLDTDDYKDADFLNVVVLNADRQNFGLIVDEIQDTTDIVVKPLGRFLKTLSIYSGATLLGDGSVGLILDVTGIAQQQLLSDRTQSADSEVSIEESRHHHAPQEFLLVRANASTKYAIPLAHVHRLEELKRSEVEFSGLQRIVRYRNSILPLLSLDEILDFPVTAETNANSEILPTVVIQRGEHLCGLEVREILDVLSTDAQVDTSIKDRPAILGNVVTENGIVVIIDPRYVVNRVFESNEAAATPQAAGHPRARILFAEDTAFFRKHVSKVLEKAGHQVTMAVDGQQAIELIDKSNIDDFDLVLSDIEMPNLGGLGLASKLRARPDGKSIPLIALTTRFDPSDIAAGHSAGFDRYLEKMDPNELLRTIEELMMKRGPKRD